jgi:hypothetical protein
MCSEIPSLHIGRRPIDEHVNPSSNVLVSTRQRSSFAVGLDDGTNSSDLQY